MSRTRASARSWHSSSPADAERPLAAGRKPSQRLTPHPVFPAGGCMTCAGRLRQGWLQRLGVASKSPRRCCRRSDCRRATTSCSARLHSCSRILAGYAGLGQLSRRIERRRESHPVATRECLESDKLVSLPSHGENRGSSPLGSANDFSNLAPKRSLLGPASPTFLQWTVLQTIGSRSRCDRRLEEAGSDCAVTAEPARC